MLPIATLAATRATRTKALLLSPYLLLTLTALFWSGNWVIGRAVHTSVPPMALAFWRWASALTFMAPFALPHVRRDWPVIRRHWRVLVLLGVLGTGIHNALSYLGLRYTTATNGVMLNSFVPVMIVALSWVFLRQRLQPLQLAGLTVSLTGVLTLLSRGSLRELAHFRLNAGDLIVIAAMLFWALYTVCLRLRPPRLHMLSFLFCIGSVGALAMLPAYGIEYAVGERTSFTAANLLAFAYVGLFPSFIAYIFWNRGVEQVGANVAGLFVHLMPVFGSVLAWLFLDEALYGYHIAGMALILTGIYFTTRNVPSVVAAD